MNRAARARGRRRGHGRASNASFQNAEKSIVLTGPRCRGSARSGSSRSRWTADLERQRRRCWRRCRRRRRRGATPAPATTSRTAARRPGSSGRASAAATAPRRTPAGPTAAAAPAARLHRLDVGGPGAGRPSSGRAAATPGGAPGSGYQPGGVCVMGDRVGAGIGQDGRMPTYIAFLRAINLGPTRKFPKDAIKAAAEKARLHGRRDLHQHRQRPGDDEACARGRRSRRRWRRRSSTDRGFEVPTIVFTPAEITAIADEATEFAQRPRRRALRLAAQGRTVRGADREDRGRRQGCRVGTGRRARRAPAARARTTTRRS